MKKTTLHNPVKVTTVDNTTGKKTVSEGKDIVDYRIVEAKLDENNEALYDSNDRIISTGRTLEWSIKAGETLEFPDYVAKYLMGIYEFLQEAERPKGKRDKGESPKGYKTAKEADEAKATTGSVNCKHCGSHFKSVKGLALHIAHAHPEVLME